MAYRSDTASPTASPSPASSSNASPYVHPSSLDGMASNEEQESSNSTQGTPNHSSSSLPRPQSAGKGGCWTCRVRRKKCDEQREGDSCKTCKRLTIKCLGWGPKRPDWMRDKKAVDEYKASIKAQLSRAGLIRGQPRLNSVQIPTQRRQATQPTPRRSTSNAISRSSTMNDHSSTYPSSRQRTESPYGQPSYSNPLIPTLPTSVPTTTLTYDPLTTYDDFDAQSGFFTNSAFSNTLGIDPMPDTHYHVHPSNVVEFLDTRLTTDFPASTQPTMQDLVMHYFNSVRQVQFLFAGDALNDVTYAAVVNDPQGAVSLAICALADLHLKQLRVSHGYETPSQAPENSTTGYLRLEALQRLEINKNTNQCWTDNDALAALHLISLSQLSGGASEWETPFNILCEWLAQTGLPSSDNPWVLFLNMSQIAQLYVKATLWIDVFSGFSKPQSPKYLHLWQALLSGDRTNFWMNGGELDISNRLRMDLLTGCPDEAILAILEISSLANWKALQQRNGCLSYPDLIRRGTAIEQKIRRHQSEQLQMNEATQSRLDDSRSLIANIFREAAFLYLHTVLSNPIPAVPEINASVETLVQLFSRLPSSDQDRGLLFPISIAACMTNDSTRRDFFKIRIRNLNESFGNLLQIRRLMEAVWQRRDVRGEEVDLRKCIQEQGLKLLLI